MVTSQINIFSLNDVRKHAVRMFLYKCGVQFYKSRIKMCACATCCKHRMCDVFNCNSSFALVTNFLADHKLKMEY